VDLIQTGGGPGSQQAEIIGNADKGERQGAHGSREIDRVGHGLHRLEQVVGFVEFQARKLPQLHDHAAVVLGVGIQAGAHRGAAYTQAAQPLG
jgi:hypothetical protein